MTFVDLGQPGVVYDTLIVSPTDSRQLVTIGVTGAIESTDGGNDLLPDRRGLAIAERARVSTRPARFSMPRRIRASTAIRPDMPGVSGRRRPARSSVTLSASRIRGTGATAPGVATQGNDLWGYFSIPAITSNPNNPEVFVKLLDGTAINGEYWFFYGGLTDLEYTLTVTDSTTGKQKTYPKPAGSECGGSGHGSVRHEPLRLRQQEHGERREPVLAGVVAARRRPFGPRPNAASRRAKHLFHAGSFFDGQRTATFPYMHHARAQVQSVEVNDLQIGAIRDNSQFEEMTPWFALPCIGQESQEPGAETRAAAELGG